jgi:hypothetical protein
LENMKSMKIVPVFQPYSHPGTDNAIQSLYREYICDLFLE